MQSGLIPKQPALVHSIVHAEAFKLTFRICQRSQFLNNRTTRKKILKEKEKKTTTDGSDFKCCLANKLQNVKVCSSSVETLLAYRQISALAIKQNSHNYHHHPNFIMKMVKVQWLLKQPSKRQQSAGPKLDTFSLKRYFNKQKPSIGSFRSRDQAAKISGHPLGSNAGTFWSCHRRAGRIFCTSLFLEVSNIVFRSCFFSAPQSAINFITDYSQTRETERKER